MGNGTLADRLKIARDDAVLTQGELAEIAGISRLHISEIETGRTKAPRPRTLRALAEALGVSVRWLRTGEGERHAR